MPRLRGGVLLPPRLAQLFIEPLCIAVEKSCLQIQLTCGIVKPPFSQQVVREVVLPRGGTPPLVPMWPGVCVVEKNPYPFFPFNPRWREEFTAGEFQFFCVLLRLAWVSPRPCLLPRDLDQLARLVEPHIRGMLPERVLARFQVHPRLNMLYFPPQLRALERLIAGEDLYSLLWDDRL